MNNQLNLVVGLTVDEGLFSMTSSPFDRFLKSVSLAFKVIGFLYNPGTTFIEGLLVNGWLTRLIMTCGRVEKFICKWTLNICMCSSSLFNFVYSMESFGLHYGFDVWDLLVLYSSKEDLRSSACDFWCSILLSQNKVNGASVEIYWLPNYQELKEALESYGFRISLSHSQDVELAEAGSCPVSPCSLIGGYFFFRFYNTTGVR
jgi:hypothetical protein